MAPRPADDKKKGNGQIDEADYQSFLEQTADPEKGLAGLPDLRPNMADAGMQWFTVGKTPLHANEARDVIWQRIHGYYTTGSPAMEMAAEYILRSVPRDAWSKELLSSLDLRPYLQAMSTWAKSAADLGIERISHKDLTWRRNNQGIDIADVAQEMDAALSLTQKGLQDFANATATGDPNERMRSFELTDSTKVGLTPMAVAELAQSQVTTNENYSSGTATTSGTNVKDAFQGISGVDVTAQFPVDDMRTAIVNDLTTIEGLASQELQQQQQLDGKGYFPVAVDAPTMRPLDVHGGQVSAPGMGNQTTIGLNDALRYLTTLPPSQVKDMQRKLAQAGYFDQVTSLTSIDEGNALDEATKTAWKALIRDSVTMNQPVWKVLGDRSKDYRQKARQARLSTLQGIDEDHNRLTANDLAQSLIGRNLTDDELKSLTHHIEQLRYERAGYVQGMPTDSSEPLPQNGYGYTDGDIQQFVMDNTEMERRNATFSDLMFAIGKKMS